MYLKSEFKVYFGLGEYSDLGLQLPENKKENGVSWRTE